MQEGVSSLHSKDLVILGISVWSSKGVQKVLNQIAQQDLSFEEKIKALKQLLRFPGMWDEGNVSKFIDVFYSIVKRYHSGNDNRITLQLVWNRFERLRVEQLMEKITLSVEEDVKKILESKGDYHHGGAHGWGGVGALSIPK